MPTKGPHSRRWLHALNRRVAASRPGAAISSRLMHHLDRRILRMSRGRFSLSSLLTGFPMVMLTTMGARSGQLRSVPLIGIPYGDEIVLIASNWGSSAHPTWYYNLRAHPNAQLAIDGRSRTCVAREATGSEREDCWRNAVDLYPGYAGYVRRAAGRTIPVIVLTLVPPVSSSVESR
jgi:deazaflavin-dependent oxidoreductase (nitroreductase family)